jgi:hypothetical protein
VAGPTVLNPMLSSSGKHQGVIDGGEKKYYVFQYLAAALTQIIPGFFRKDRR